MTTENLLDSILDVTPNGNGNGNGNDDAKRELSPNRLTSPLSGQSHFTDSQEKDAKHKHVSKIWTDQCLSWDQLQDALEESAQANSDVMVEPSELRLVEGTETLIVPDPDSDVDATKEVERRVLRLYVAGKGEYDFSNHSFGQVGLLSGLGSRLASVGRDDYEIDRTFQIYKHRFENVLLEREEKNKKVFLRLRHDQNGPSVRAMLSEQYGVIDHRWVAETQRKILGDDALISHFDSKAFAESGGDIVKYNVLIPDSIRAESDSDYGGMVSTFNGEVGNARVSVLPAVFRAICMNGCIWGKSSDKRFRVSRVHKGEINKEYFAVDIKEAINAAIPLLESGIDLLLNSRNLVSSDANLLQLVLATSDKYFKLDRSETRGLLDTIMDETLTQRPDAFSTLGVFTRYSQDSRFSLTEREQMEETVGELLTGWSEQQKSWELLVANATAVDVTAASV